MSWGTSTLAISFPEEPARSAKDGNYLAPLNTKRGAHACITYYLSVTCLSVRYLSIRPSPVYLSVTCLPICFPYVHPSHVHLSVLINLSNFHPKITDQSVSAEWRSYIITHTTMTCAVSVRAENQRDILIIRGREIFLVVYKEWLLNRSRYWKLPKLTNAPRLCPAHTKLAQVQV